MLKFDLGLCRHLCRCIKMLLETIATRNRKIWDPYSIISRTRPFHPESYNPDHLATESGQGAILTYKRSHTVFHIPLLHMEFFSRLILFQNTFFSRRKWNQTRRKLSNWNSDFRYSPDPKNLSFCDAGRILFWSDISLKV